MPRLAPAASAALIAALLGAPAQAQSVAQCDFRASAAALAEPWADHTRTYANGAIRVALSDVGAPGSGPLHLIVLAPSGDPADPRLCRVVSLDGTLGFADIAFGAGRATYDPARGLALLFDVRAQAASEARTAVLEVVVNQATGSIAASLY
ncbi:MAG: hypothetical protein ACU0CO_06615 [Shimia sp.]